jgi:hypothetical protein
MNEIKNWMRIQWFDWIPIVGLITGLRRFYATTDTLLIWALFQCLVGGILDAWILTLI